jgi:hypothetical protein
MPDVQRERSANAAAWVQAIRGSLSSVMQVGKRVLQFDRNPLNHLDAEMHIFTVKQLIHTRVGFPSPAPSSTTSNNQLIP